jgi:DNA-binding NarL/FixJ family response regulator
MSKITILIADDHKLIRETWSFVLNTDPRFQVVGVSGDAEEAIQMVKDKNPSIVLMDINMTPVSGLEATEKIRKNSPHAKIIGVSMHSQPAFAKKMLSMGARGYVTKNSSKEEMIQAIIQVNDGKKYICEEIKNIISDQLFEDNDLVNEMHALTEREIQIINEIRKGHSSREIAYNLEISLKTVEVHRHNILRKLKLKNSASLVDYINTHSIYI